MSKHSMNGIKAILARMAEHDKIAAEERRLDTERWRLLIERLDERHEEVLARSDAHLRALVAILDRIGENGPGGNETARSSR